MFGFVTGLFSNWGIKGQVKTLESDLITFKNVTKENPQYENCQRLIPFMEVELRQLKAKL